MPVKGLRRVIVTFRQDRCHTPERLVFIQKAKRFGLSLDEIKRLIDLRADGVPPCADLQAMVKQHLAELDQHIQDMLTLRQELAQRYEYIEAVLSDSTEAPNETLCNGKICGLIEQDIEPE